MYRFIPDWPLTDPHEGYYDASGNDPWYGCYKGWKPNNFMPPAQVPLRVNYLEICFESVLRAHTRLIWICFTPSTKQLHLKLGRKLQCRCMVLDETYPMFDGLLMVCATMDNPRTFHMTWTSSLGVVRVVTYEFAKDNMYLTVTFGKILEQEVVDGPKPILVWQPSYVPTWSSSYVPPGNESPDNWPVNVETVIVMSKYQL